MPKGRSARSTSEDFAAEIASASGMLVSRSSAKAAMTDDDVVVLYAAARSLFRASILQAGFDEAIVRALITKYNDAGPRSAPWKPVSGRVPGRPQDRADGNRINRWQLPSEHKFHSTQVDGTLVAIKYLFQTLAMTGAPTIPPAVSNAFQWLVGHEIRPGAFLDPIQRIDVPLRDVVENPRIITSGHIVPLDRGGRHVPTNTSLMLKLSNDLQGNNTLEELLTVIHGILTRHGRI